MWAVVDEHICVVYGGASRGTSARTSNVTHSECAELVLCACVPMNVHTQTILEGVPQERLKEPQSPIHGGLVGSL